MSAGIVASQTWFCILEKAKQERDPQAFGANQVSQAALDMFELTLLSCYRQMTLNCLMGIGLNVQPRARDLELLSAYFRRIWSSKRLR